MPLGADVALENVVKISSSSSSSWMQSLYMAFNTSVDTFFAPGRDCVNTGGLRYLSSKCSLVSRSLSGSSQGSRSKMDRIFVFAVVVVVVQIAVMNEVAVCLAFTVVAFQRKALPPWRLSRCSFGSVGIKCLFREHIIFFFFFTIPFLGLYNGRAD